jgi:hypothetical protein
LAKIFEDEAFAAVSGVALSSPITGILFLPGIIDKAIAPTPPDSVVYQKRDGSVSVGIKVDFDLWERSSELERLGLLTDNIRCSLDKIKSRYLYDEDREILHGIVDKVQALLAYRLRESS